MAIIYEYFESVTLRATAAAWGIRSEADYQRALAACHDCPIDEVSHIYEALGHWALIHDRLDEAEWAYSAGLRRCYDEESGAMSSFGLMRNLAALRDSSFREGNGDPLRDDWIRLLESELRASDPARGVFLAHVAATCAWQGRMSQAKSLLDRLVELMRKRGIQRRRAVARLLSGNAGGYTEESAALLREAAERIYPPPV